MRTRIATLACLIGLTLAPRAALAQWPVNGVVLTYPWLQIDGVRMSPDGSGGLLVSWIASGGGTQQLLATGVSSTGAIPAGWPSGGKFIAYSNDGQAVPDAVGGMILGGTTQTFPGLDSYAWHVTSAGAEDWTMAVAATTTHAEEHTSVIGDGAGGAYVAWVKDDVNVYVQRIQSNGTRAPGWPAAGVPVSGLSTSYVLSTPALGLAGANGVVVMWPSDFVTAVLVTPSGTLSANWNDGGSAFGGNSPDDCRILPSDADHFYAVWEDVAPSRRLLATRMAYADGSTDAAWPADGIVVADGIDAGKEQVITDGAGGLLAAWSAGTSSPRGVRYLADASLATGWPAAGVALNSQTTGRWVIANAGGNGFAFAWDTPLHSIGSIGHVQWFLGDGTQDPTQPAGGQLVSPADTMVNIRGAQPDGIGGVYVAWDHEDANFRMSLMLSRVTYPTPLGVPPPVGPHALSLAIVGANPSRGDFAVSCTLSGTTTARLELFDVGGRRVREAALAGGGARTVRFDDAARLAPGLYVARLTQAGLSRSTRIAIVR